MRAPDYQRKLCSYAYLSSECIRHSLSCMPSIVLTVISSYFYRQPNVTEPVELDQASLVPSSTPQDIIRVGSDTSGAAFVKWLSYVKMNRKPSASLPLPTDMKQSILVMDR